MSDNNPLHKSKITRLVLLILPASGDVSWKIFDKATKEILAMTMTSLNYELRIFST
uniref:Uncharacterized protein n=1 Tax=Candidatus Kentrum sp. LFY TaxID=2126342 RepID=A0A450UGQ8_9GAMM|nr:MAG: hypothetical protein BECKLFY1418B_GA0070995_102814 [Candidatus Kentron sp. LFY]